MFMRLRKAKDSNNLNYKDSKLRLTKFKKYLQVRFRKDCLICNADLIALYDEPFVVESIIDLCKQCKFQFTFNIYCCEICAIPLPNNSQLLASQNVEVIKLVCGDCQKQKPLWAKALTSFIYEYPLDRLLVALKYNRRIDYIKTLARLLSHDIELEYSFFDSKTLRPEFIVPVPLHLFRESQRGYNQAQLLARELSKKLGLPLETNLIRRVRHTPQQSQLSKKQRTKNLAKAFEINSQQYIPKYIALVDDVMTTGSTAHAITKVLLDAGVKRVDVWCIARAE